MRPAYLVVVVVLVCSQLFIYLIIYLNDRESSGLEDLGPSQVGQNSQPERTRSIAIVQDSPSKHHRCPLLNVPGPTLADRNGLFSFVTSHYFDKKSKSLYVLSLGRGYFNPEWGKNNYAVNLTFSYELLAHPASIYPRAIWNDIETKCIPVRVGKKDISISSKVNMAKCSFSKAAVGEYIVLIGKDEEMCLRLKINKGPQGVVQQATKRVGRKSVGSEPTMSWCLAGVANFNFKVIELIKTQMMQLELDHLYIGLNTEERQVRESYANHLADFRNRITISLPSPGQEIVRFSQGKLQFLNECLFHAKYHDDTFVGVWDSDEMLHAIVHPEYSLAWYLMKQLGQKLNSTCYIKLKAETFMANPQNLDPSFAESLGEAFNYHSISARCGNYTKSIAIVPLTDYLGLHAPESCVLYPLHGTFSSAHSSFVASISSLTMIHFVQLWVRNRNTNKCLLVKDESIRAYFVPA